MAKVKRIAEIFNRNANGLFELMGYTRQNVNLILDGRVKPKSERFAQTIDALSQESYRLYNEDVARAEARRLERAKFIEELRSKGGGTDE